MESSAPAARLAPAVLDPRRWWALALLCGAFFMVILDGTITIVALPSIGADLRFSEQGLQWVLSAYALTSAAARRRTPADLPAPSCWPCRHGAGAPAPRPAAESGARVARSSPSAQVPGTEETRTNAADQRRWHLTHSTKGEPKWEGSS